MNITVSGSVDNSSGDRTVNVTLHNAGKDTPLASVSVGATGSYSASPAVGSAIHVKGGQSAFPWTCNGTVDNTGGTTAVRVHAGTTEYALIAAGATGSFTASLTGDNDVSFDAA